ncbi:calcium-binding protein [Pseudotabrizicola alkalilacus]|uniref:Calcium-binding protein n=1 Tax=Pseudotabrizicola alkalilacus TaxID=2305252 RepID=A0A411YWC9_9RHOB|nr:calcium-binding protein [Pseudotabrizicola alkalilacus]RGP35204.1 calcium-binding protein [Pseudotabrizicola alkalilacus]
MALGMLIMGGLFLSALLINFSQEPDEESSDHTDEDSGDSDDDLADYLPDSESGGTEELEEGEQAPDVDETAPDLYLDGNTLTIVIPENGSSRVDVTQSGSSVEELRIESDRESVQLSWGQDDDGAWISISSGEGQLDLDFPGFDSPPLDSFTITGCSTTGELFEVMPYDYITDQESATFLFGSHDLSARDVDPNSFLIGGADHDTIISRGDGAHAEVSFERGILQTSGPWTGQIFGEAGNDTIVANEGNFLIYGAAGNDWIELKGSSAVVFGGMGNDTLSSETHASFLSGDDGNDELRGGGGHDTLIGGAGRDTLFGGGGNDLLDGHGLWITEPAERVASLSSMLESSPNLVYGGDGADTIIATAGDMIYGGDGADSIVVYILPGEQPVDLRDFDASDTLVVDVILRDPFNDDEMQEQISFQNSEGTVKLLFHGDAIVVLPAESVTGNSSILVRFSAVGPDGEYLG